MGGDIDAEFPHRRMVEEETAERSVMAALDHLTCAAIIADLGCPAAARSVQSAPTAAGLQPFPNESALIVVGIRTGHISYQRLALGQPTCDVGEISGDGRAHPRIFLQ